MGAPYSRHIAAANAIRWTGAAICLALLIFAAYLVRAGCPTALSPDQCLALLDGRTSQLGDLFMALAAVGTTALGGSSAATYSSAQRHAGAHEPSSAVLNLGEGEAP